MSPNQFSNCLLSFLLLLLFSSCAKDYSYEGGAIPVTPIDTTVLPPPSSLAFPKCALCDPFDDVLELGEWNFNVGDTYLCGRTDNAGFIGTNQTFTFFGPSACSIDTGITVTVYLPIAFDQDRYGITTTNTAFYYYDHNATKDIFISLPAATFTVTVDSYIAATRIARGTFGGTVFKPNGDTVTISKGYFKVELK